MIRTLLQALLLIVAAATATPAAWAQKITIYSAGSLAIGSQRQLTAYVQLSPNTVSWAVNGVPGGNAALGTVSSSGLYQAPAAVPQPNTVTVSATSTAYPREMGSATMTITQVQPRLWSISPASVPAGAYTLTLNGAAFGSNAVVRVGGVSLPTTRVSATRLTATGTAAAAQVGSKLNVDVLATGLGAISSDVVHLSIVAAGTPPTTPTPPPTTPTPPGSSPGTGLGTADLAWLRLLDQATFGPTASDLQRIKSLGVNGWLNEQFTLPETAIEVPASGDNRIVQSQFLARLSAAPDQLRQRMAYALGQVLVISINKNNYANETAPFLQILSRHAFGNYRALLGEVATSAQMGKYLDLANSNKPAPGSSANENFPRELLQLFTLGLVRLKPDGTPQLDAAGSAIATYGQDDVQQLALAFTGWTYAGAGNNNWENFSGPLVPRDVNHDLRAKSFLGCSLPANQGAQQDMAAALDCVFKHPNVAPFVSLRLIRQLVKSNPSPAYVARVSAVFNDNGSGVRGDLKAVARAILTDAEARDDAARADGGRLRDPIQQIVALVRALGGSISPGNQMAWEFTRSGQTPLGPPSVFGFYSPLFRLPGNAALAAPEFQIYTPTEAVLRGNFIWRLLGQPGSDASINLAPYTAAAGTASALIDKVDQTLLYGRMPAALRSVLAAQIDAQGSDTAARVRTALYFTALSGLYAIQH
ncbi:MAG: DUF1800 family protein [Rubrivivax sp.]